MTSEGMHGLKIRAVAVVAACLSLAAVQPAAANTNPFEELAGAWRGEGTLEPLGGDAEPVRCRADYGVAGNRVTQNITCAGTGYTIRAVAAMTYSGGELSGSWKELNYGAGGGATGSVKGDTIFVRISGDSFTGRMSINVSDSEHVVKITQFDAGNGKYRNVANLSLRR